MVANASLRAKLRNEVRTNAVKKLRASGQVPAVLYGHGEQNRNLVLDAHELDRLFSHIHKENTIINLDIEGEAVNVLVREVQSDPVKPVFLHVDFYQIHSGEVVTVAVPIILDGTPAGVRAGGILQKVLDELEIRVMPDQIPEAIHADVSGLEINGSLHVRDLTLPQGVNATIDGERTVCSVIPPTVQATEGGAGEGRAEPELVRRAKEES